MPQSLVFDGVTAGAPDDSLRRLIGDGRALVWLTRDAPFLIRFDDEGRVAEEASLRIGGRVLQVGRGCRVAGDGESIAITAAAGSLTFGGRPIERIDVGEDGRLTYGAEIDPSATSIRYFYAAGGVQGLRYPVGSGGATGNFVPAAASVDPTGRAGDRFAIAGQGSFVSGFVSDSGEPLTLSTIPQQSNVVPAWDPQQGQSYFTLDGDYEVSLGPTGPTGPFDVLLGLWGLETAHVPGPAQMRFVAGSPAFASSFNGASGAASLTAQAAGSEFPVTTAWIYFPQPEGPVSLAYHSQPRGAGLFTNTGVTAGDPLLGALDIAAAGFPEHGGVLGAPAAAFPAVPYASLTASDLGPYAAFENVVLSPLRADAIDALNGIGGASGPTGASGPAGPTGLSGPTGPIATAVTPQGLLATFSADLSTWESLVLARSGPDAAQITNLQPPLRNALLASQLFLVITDKTALDAPYLITDEVLAAAQASGVPPEILAAVGTLAGIQYQSLPYFEPALRGVLGDAYGQYGDLFLSLAQTSSLAISGWTFDLAPRRWNEDTILVIKYADATIAALAGELSRWTMPARFNADPGAVQKRLQAIVAAADDASADFASAVNGPWNGVLYLDCNVPPTELPPQLLGLAVGIDPSTFRAHHLGIGSSSIEPGSTLSTGDASLFALIDYENPGDLSYQGEPYDFKVLLLRVGFANSQITAFASRIELLVGNLFGERSTIVGGSHGDNLLLDGTWQRHGSQDSYSFSTAGPSLFTMDSAVLASVSIDAAQFVTINDPAAGDDVVSQLILAGTLRYQRLEEFDLFSFGAEPEDDATDPGSPGLAFTNLLVVMSYDPASTPLAPVFAFTAGNMVLNLAQSTARAGSLYARFPLLATAMLQGDASATPASLGFVPVASPLDPNAPGTPWFGLQMSLVLGSPGGLAASLDLTASLLAVWGPSADGSSVSVGLRLPGSQSGRKSLQIVGPLALDIGDIAFLFDEAQQAYLLRFSQIALQLLGLSFPPGGGTNMLLFGNPGPQSGRSALGWYAAYAKEKG